MSAVITLKCLSQKYQDQHLHDQRKWASDITPHWPHQLPTVGVKKHMLSCSKFRANNFVKICALSFCHRLDATWRLSHDINWNSRILINYRPTLQQVSSLPPLKQLTKVLMMDPPWIETSWRIHLQQKPSYHLQSISGSLQRKYNVLHSTWTSRLCWSRSMHWATTLLLLCAVTACILSGEKPPVWGTQLW